MNPLITSINANYVFDWQSLVIFNKKQIILYKDFKVNRMQAV